jgi:hypothetical protein
MHGVRQSRHRRSRGWRNLVPQRRHHSLQLDHLLRRFDNQPIGSACDRRSRSSGGDMTTMHSTHASAPFNEIAVKLLTNRVNICSSGQHPANAIMRCNLPIDFDDALGERKTDGPTHLRCSSDLRIPPSLGQTSTSEAGRPWFKCPVTTPMAYSESVITSGHVHSLGPRRRSGATPRAREVGWRACVAQERRRFLRRFLKKFLIFLE